MPIAGKHKNGKESRQTINIEDILLLRNTLTQHGLAELEKPEVASVIISDSLTEKGHSKTKNKWRY